MHATSSFGSLASPLGPRLLPALLCTIACCGPRGGAVEPTAAPDAADVSPAKESGRSPGTRAQPSLPPASLNVLDAHNRYRADHCAPPLEWSSVLAAAAQGWADELRDQGCAFAHSRSTRFGENLFFAAPSSAESGARAVETWYSERGSYDFARPGFSMQTGHFSQVVWRGTRELGCGAAQCNGGDLWVCNYLPAGNVRGQYEANVSPTSCRP